MTSRFESPRAQGVRGCRPAGLALCVCGLLIAACASTLDRTNLDRAQAELDAALADTDGDGVVDTTDQCPGTADGEPVDLAGCSQFQFCSAIQVNEVGRAGCTKADWRNDEAGTGPQDCMTRRRLCLPR